MNIVTNSIKTFKEIFKKNKRSLRGYDVFIRPELKEGVNHVIVRSMSIEETAGAKALRQC